MEQMTKEQLESYKKALLEEYRAQKEEAEYAQNDMEERWAEEKLEKYRIQIRACAAKIAELAQADTDPDEQA
jgi:hypothetical protein